MLVVAGATTASAAYAVREHMGRAISQETCYRLAKIVEAIELPSGIVAGVTDDRTVQQFRAWQAKLVWQRAVQLGLVPSIIWIVARWTIWQVSKILVECWVTNNGRWSRG